MDILRDEPNVSQSTTGKAELWNICVIALWFQLSSINRKNAGNSGGRNAWKLKSKKIFVVALAKWIF